MPKSKLVCNENNERNASHDKITLVINPLTDMAVSCNNSHGWPSIKLVQINLLHILLFNAPIPKHRHP